MKFREMTYTRPDIDALLARCKELAAKAESAASGEALVAVYYEQSRAFADYNTAANLASIHYTCDTRDAAWKAEQDFFDANGPAVQNASVEISRAFLANPHVDALTEAFGTTCVAGMKNAVLGMDDRTIDLQKEYNALVSQYQQVYGGALVEFDGKQLTIPQLGPYKENLDPAVRRAAYEAEAGYFDAHRAELDELYTKIVKNLNEQAKILGYHDYSELSYVRMNRIGYGPEEIRKFRDQVANDVVPQLKKVIELRKKRTGIEHLTFTDLPVSFSAEPSFEAEVEGSDRTLFSFPSFTVFPTAEAPVEIEETSVSADALTVIFDQETRIELNMQLENYYPGRSLDLGQGITINLKVRKKGGLIFNV